MQNLKTNQIVSFLCIVILLFIIYIQIASRILFTSIDFDEGYNLQISRNLHANPLNYATFLGLFDPNITTGPTVLIPAAFFINNRIALLPRIIMLLYGILFLFLCLKFIFQSNRQKILFLICVMLTPLFYFFSSHILGELPGFVFLLVALIAVSRKRYFWSGLAIFLSILTKQVYIFSLLPVIFIFMISIVFTKKDKNKKNMRDKLSVNSAEIIGGFFSGLFSWCLYIIISVRYSYVNFVRVIHDEWQTMHSLSQPKLSLIDQRLDMLHYVFSVPGLVMAILIMVVCSYVMRNHVKRNIIAGSLAFYCLIYLLYFLFEGATNWYRHLFPAILALIIIIPFYLDSIITETNKRNKIIISVFLLVLLINALYYFTHIPSDDFTKKLIDQNLIFYHEKVTPFTAPDSLFISQQKTALFINDFLPKNPRIAGISWWTVPEIAYLTNKQIGNDPFNKTIQYVLTDYYGDLLGQNDYKFLTMIPKKKVLFHTDGYTLFKK